ncbi:MAG TPA: FHA domain-containing protein [Armatimonadota bacterium]
MAQRNKLLEGLRRRFVQPTRSWTHSSGTYQFAAQDLNTESLYSWLEDLAEEALKRSSRSRSRGSEGETANLLSFALYLATPARGLQVEEEKDAIGDDLSRGLTQWAEERGLVVPGRVVQVEEMVVKRSPNPTLERLEVRWRVDRGAMDHLAGGLSATELLGTVEEPFAQHFQLFVRDGAGVQPYSLKTSFTFGLRVDGASGNVVPVRDPALERLISKQHFSIHFENKPGVDGFVLVDHSTNGTLIRRGDRAIHLKKRGGAQEQDYYRELWLKAGDLIAVNSGDASGRREPVVMLFSPGDGQVSEPVPPFGWNGSLQGLRWGYSTPVQALHRPDGLADPASSRVIVYNGDVYLGLNAAGDDIYVAHNPNYSRFRRQQAVALIRNWGTVSLEWLDREVQATFQGAPLEVGREIDLEPEDSLQVEGEGVPRGHIRFRWEPVSAHRGL